MSLNTFNVFTFGFIGFCKRAMKLTFIIHKTKERHKKVNWIKNKIQIKSCPRQWKLLHGIFPDRKIIYLFINLKCLSPLVIMRHGVGTGYAAINNIGKITCFYYFWMISIALLCLPLKIPLTRSLTRTLCIPWFRF